jgi:folate-binding protein YgfZ
MAVVTPNPLYAYHQQAQAEFQPYGALEIVSTFGEPQAEYAAIRKSCGLIDQPQRAMVELSGPDRLTFLNNLLTNQTYDKQTKSPLPAGSAAYAFLLDAKTGRIQLDVHVLELGERTLLELDRRLVDGLLPTLERYLFAEKVKIIDRRDDLHQLALHGPGAQAVLDELLDLRIEPLQENACAAARLLGHDAVAWRDDVCAVPGLHLILPSDAAAKVWMHLVTRFGSSDDPGSRRLRTVGWAALNATRVEAGRALFGIDFDDQTLPAETGALLNKAVSFTKGCYPGQEVVARMHARGQVARQIVGVRMSGDALPLAGTQVFDPEDHVIGVVTSSTISPVLSNAAICLATVKRPHFAEGATLRIPAEGAVHDGVVVNTPFV